MYSNNELFAIAYEESIAMEGLFSYEKKLNKKIKKFSSIPSIAANTIKQLENLVEKMNNAQSEMWNTNVKTAFPSFLKGFQANMDKALGAAKQGVALINKKEPGKAMSIADTLLGMSDDSNMKYNTVFNKVENPVTSKTNKVAAGEIARILKTLAASITAYNDKIASVIGAINTSKDTNKMDNLAGMRIIGALRKVYALYVLAFSALVLNKAE